MFQLLTFLSLPTESSILPCFSSRSQEATQNCRGGPEGTATSLG